MYQKGWELKIFTKKVNHSDDTLLFLLPIIHSHCTFYSTETHKLNSWIHIWETIWTTSSLIRLAWLVWQTQLIRSPGSFPYISLCSLKRRKCDITWLSLSKRREYWNDKKSMWHVKLKIIKLFWNNVIGYLAVGINQNLYPIVHILLV